MYQSLYTPADLEKHLVKEPVLFPRIEDRVAWEGLLSKELNRSRKSWLQGTAVQLIEKPWPALPATLYLRFSREGNRAGYERPYFDRRTRLGLLVLAECFENENRFTDPLIDAIWSICEETAWCIPAHAWTRSVRGMPSADLPFPDLFACETAAVLSMAVHLMGSRLDAVSAAIRDQVRKQVLEQVIVPVETTPPDDTWMNRGMNWNPWCAANTMLAGLVWLQDDRPRLIQLMWKLLKGVDVFINAYAEDGGCDEGPMYWGVAAGALLHLMELVHDNTAGAISLYHDPKIRAMGEYISNVHLSGPWFAAFADSNSRLRPHPGTLWQYGKRTGSEPMQRLAIEARGNWAKPLAPFSTEYTGQALLIGLRDVFWMPADASVPEAAPATSTYLADIQVLAARADGARLTLAAKGGNNAESHNHNDVGQFILLQDESPVIVDPGRENYTKQTFGDRRYELWFTRGSGHNVPVVNDVEQVAGPGAAKGVHCELGNRSASLQMDITACYPATVGIVRLERRIAWTPDRLVVADSLEMTGSAKQTTVRIPLWTPAEVERVGEQIHLRTPRSVCVLKLSAGAIWDVVDVPMTDDVTRAAWGERLRRIDLRFQSDGPTLAWNLSFEPAHEVRP